MVCIIAPTVGAIIGGSIYRALAGQGADKAPE
jgi:hypothetical protein